jgi:hypothetical protein
MTTIQQQLRDPHIGSMEYEIRLMAADEMDRLAAVNAELLAALRAIAAAEEAYGDPDNAAINAVLYGPVRAALTRVEGNP